MSKVALQAMRTAAPPLAPGVPVLDPNQAWSDAIAVARFFATERPAVVSEVTYYVRPYDGADVEEWTFGLGGGR